MKLLTNIKNYITDLVISRPAAFGSIARLIIAFLALSMLRENIGFNEILSNVVFVVFFSVACAFIPFKLMLIAIAGYSAIQIFSLSAGLGIITCIIFLVMYLLFYRFDSKRGFVVLLIPLLCMIRLPILVPLVLAVTAPLGALVGSLCGIVAYYYIHYIQMNAAVFQGMADAGTTTTEINKMSMAVQGLFTNKEMIFTIVCIVIMFVAAYFIKKIHINRSSIMAVSMGAGIYLVLIITSVLLFGTITYSKLVWYVVGTVISCIVAMIVSSLALPLDYNRTELLEFEDEEYKYYVRAVPKARVVRQSVRVKRIYSRKREKV